MARPATVELQSTDRHATKLVELFLPVKLPVPNRKSIGAYLIKEGTTAATLMLVLTRQSSLPCHPITDGWSPRT